MRSGIGTQPSHVFSTTSVNYVSDISTLMGVSDGSVRQLSAPRWMGPCRQEIQLHEIEDRIISWLTHDFGEDAGTECATCTDERLIR